MKKTNNKYSRKRFWRSVVSTLAAIVVFVTTYALIIPAITWEKTLICELEEHVHTGACYNSQGELICTREAHRHTDACFDAPRAAEKLYICGKAEHTHSADCYFSDGTLKCTLPEHRHTLECRNNYRMIVSDAASDGAVAEISGVLPENAQAAITAVSLGTEELVAYFGAEKAAQMTGYVAYDIKIIVNGEEWQPNETVSVTVRHPELEMGGGNRLNLAHVADGTDNVTDVEVQKNADGDVVFNADGFSLYIFYTSFTVDFHYEGADYSMNGRTAMRLGALFTELGIDSDVAGVQSVVFSNPELLRVESVDGDWLLTSLEPFDTDETLTVMFADESSIVIDVTDALDGQTHPAPPSGVVEEGANDWQIVAEGFAGNGLGDKIPYNKDGYSDPKPEIYLQKNVVPTENENEFLIYLSAAKPVSIEEWIRTSTLWTLENNNTDAIGYLRDGTPSTNGKGPIYAGNDPDGSSKNKILVDIYVYDHVRFTSDSNDNYIITESGTLLAHWNEERGTDVSKCSNGSVYLYMKEINKFTKLCNGVNFHPPKSGGSGHPFRVYISLDLMVPEYINFTLKETALDSVEDVLGPMLELYPTDPNDINTAIKYCDGTCTINSDETTLNWTISENLNDRWYTYDPLDATWNNAAQLVYRVRLKTEAEGFDSCAERIAGGSTITDPDSYKTNDHATIAFHTEPLTGGSGATLSYTEDFSIPYVRGLNYDLRFKKVSNTGKELPGAVFRLLDENKNRLKDINGKEYPDVVSGPDGCVDILDLPVLPTYIMEVSAPLGYQLPTNNTFGPLKRNYTVCSTTERSSCFTRETEDYPDNMRNKQNGSGGGLWEIGNTPMPGKTIVFKKIDSETGAAIRGVQFALYGSDASGNMNTNPLPGYENLVSLWNGIFSPDDLSLPYGTYYLKETAARTGYLELTAPIRIDVTSTNVSVTGTDGSPSVSIDAGVYTITIQNVHEEEIQPIFVPDEPENVTIKKQIDWLGDQGITGMDDLYRLYLSLQTNIEPMDLLLVIDQSTSMTQDMDGNAKYLSEDTKEPNPDYDPESVRQDLIINFLNGTASDDGFIAQYLDANTQNRLAILTFGSDCSYSDSRYIRKWDSTARSVTLGSNPVGATNYAAALDVASVILKESSDSAPDKRRVMIFLSDGVPTLAYSDGKMHRSFAYEMVGGGNNRSILSAVGMVQIYLHYSSSDPSLWDSFMNQEYDTIVDDLGNKYGRRNHFCEPESPLVSQANLDWPVTYDITTMALEIPGTNFPKSGITNQTAFDEFKIRWTDFSDDQKLAWIITNMKYPGDSYDIFDLTKSAFNEFSKKNPNVPVFTILFSSEDGTLKSERSDNEVLLHMSGDEHPDAPEERFYHYQRCEDGETLAAVIKGIAGLSKVKITDPLSDYVDFETDPAHPDWTAAKASQFEIRLTHETYRSYYEEGKDFAYLYKDGAFTALGRLLLDTTATKIDAVNKTVDVVFNEKYIYSGEFYCEASFNVRVNETAKLAYILGDYNATGDDDTDYPGNTTSTGKPGFCSNDGASAEWIYYGENGDDYAEPVVQVHPINIRLDKVNNRRTKLSGAEFNLFLEVAEETAGAIVYTDLNNETHYLLRLNTDPLVSGTTDPITVGKMFDGTYYLFETKAPDGYTRLTSPVVIELDSGTILTADKSAVVDENDPLLLSIINTFGGELPATGGSGIKSIYTLGILLLAGALMAGVVLRCKYVRKGRQE